MLYIFICWLKYRYRLFNMLIICSGEFWEEICVNFMMLLKKMVDLLNCFVLMILFCFSCFVIDLGNIWYKSVFVFFFFFYWEFLFCNELILRFICLIWNFFLMCFYLLKLKNINWFVIDMEYVWIFDVREYIVNMIKG